MKRSSIIVTVLFIIAALAACGAGDKQSGAAGQNEKNGTAAPGTNAALLVKIKNLTYQKFEHFFQANGSVEAVNDAFISPEINGQIKKIHVREGQRVKKGQLLVSLNSDIIQGSIAEVKTGLELAQTVYDKRKGLWDKKIGSEIQYLEAKTNKDSLENKLATLQAQLEMTRIKAPIPGIVDEVFKKEGELATPGFQLIRLVNLDKVYVNAEVSESYIAKIRTGDMVTVLFPSYADLAREAAIHRTSQVVNPTNRTFLVQLLMDNRDEKLKPNMMARIRINDFSAFEALVVPSIIIKNDMTGPYLYVVKKEKDGTLLAAKTYVTPGLTEGGSTMINSGLQAGQQVIVQGYNLVKNGMAVKIEN